MSATSSAEDRPASGGRLPRSVALVGPYGSGKSTLFEALLAAAGSPLKRVTDPRNRTMSTELRISHASFLGEEWTLIDCPGSVEFAFETESALAVADFAVLVCDPLPDRALTVAPLLKYLEDQGIPYLLFINKIDTLAGAVREAMAALQAHTRRPLVLRQVPIREADAVTGYVDLVSERAYRYRRGQPSELIRMPQAMAPREQEARFSLVETLADHDDALLEKVLEDAIPTPEELYRQWHADQVQGVLAGVLLGAGLHENGVRRLWKALRHDAPDPSETASRRGIPPEGDALVQVFKTVHAGHAGKLSYGRIWRGRVRDGGSLEGMRIGGLFRFQAGEPAKVAEAGTGEIVALGRLEGVATGATLGAGPDAPALPFPQPRAPVHAVAIATSDRKDDVKLSAALQKLVEEDPSLGFRHDQELGQSILTGQGEIHLNAALDRLQRGFGLTIATSRPRVAFRETIRRAVQQHSRLKRQTGGHGQFADVKIEVEPRERGEGFQFSDRIVGGAVPKQYIPAVGEAAEAATQKGVYGYPVVDIAVTLVDGTFHSVDSSDMAFKSATRMAMTEALAKAEPILLEPVDRVTVSVPNSFTAGAQRLLTGRRGQILGYAEKPGWPGWDDVEALVPEAEMHDFIVELRSQTMGLGSFTHSFDHLAEARGRVAEWAAQQAAKE
ncbi:MAG TPA: elongation factor G [Acetobacteraceae bacterium]|nr:elongation factor G [Acetobacteraceae bacterium]